MKIAIAVQSGLTHLNTQTDDWLIKLELERRGIEVDLIDWQNPTVNLEQYDSIFVSSTWNMPKYAEEVFPWLQRCELGKKRLINDADIIKLSLNKEKYLAFLLDEFGDKDAIEGSITPSAFIHPEEKITLEQKLSLLRQNNPIWSGDIVIKPMVSADGIGTYRFTRDADLLAKDNKKYRPFSEAETLIKQLLAINGNQGVILQPFIPFVEQSGEYQLVYLGNDFSHATVKPKGFKNNNTSERRPLSTEELPPGMLDFANRLMNFYLKQYPDGITRARFDFFASEKGPILCEAEMIEPNTNIRRLHEKQQVQVINKYADVLIKRTEQLMAIANIKEVLNGELSDEYSKMIKHPDICKAVIKIYQINIEVLNYLKNTNAGNKHALALQHSKYYLIECFQALNEFSKKDNPTLDDKKLLLSALNKAKVNYSQSVLGHDRSALSKTVRLMLMAAVNFIASLSFGIAHYINYKKTGHPLFYGETRSEAKLRKAHQELNQDLEHAFKLDK